MNALQYLLRQPFPFKDVGFKPQVVSKDKGKAMAVTYIDPRAVAERLDEAFGLNWSVTQSIISDTPNKCVVQCTITVQHGDVLVSRGDLGTSDNSDAEADRHKTAASDAVKRAAVQFGIGAYLYDLPKLWVPYNGERKQITDEGYTALENGYNRAVEDWKRAHPAPPIPLDAARALKLEQALTGKGVPTHHIPTFATLMLNRPVTSLVGITEDEGKLLLHEAARPAQPSPSPGTPPSDLTEGQGGAS